MKRLKLTIASLLIGLGLLAVALPASVSAQSATDAVCKGIGSVDASGNCTTAGSGPSVQSIISMSVTVLSYVVGVAAIIMLIVGGFKYITSNGDSSKVASAKNTVMYALVGVAVAALAQVMVHFVFTKATTPTPPPPNPAASNGKS